MQLFHIICSEVELAGDNRKRSEHFLSVSPSDIGPAKKRKLLLSSLGNRRVDALPNPPTKASEEEKHVNDPYRENKDLSTGKSLHVKTSEFTGKGPVSKQHAGPSISYKYSKVTRRPVMDSRKWLKLEERRHFRLCCFTIFPNFHNHSICRYTYMDTAVAGNHDFWIYMLSLF